MTSKLWRHSSRVISGGPVTILSLPFFVDWFDIVTYLEENLAPMYLPKMSGNLFFSQIFKMAAKIAAGTYNFVTNLARRLILVYRHMFLGSSYLFWPTVVFWNDHVMHKSKMAASRHFEIYSNLSMLALNAIRRQTRCHFPQMHFHYKH